MALEWVGNRRDMGDTVLLKYMYIVDPSLFSLLAGLITYLPFLRYLLTHSCLSSTRPILLMCLPHISMQFPNQSPPLSMTETLSAISRAFTRHTLCTQATWLG